MSTPFDPIEVNYKGIDGAAHTAAIQPLKRRDGVEVLHLLLGAIGGSLDTDTVNALSKGDLSGLVSMIGKLINAIKFDDFWTIARKLLRFSVIDLKECNDLNDFDGFDRHFADLYSLVFEALKVNYPDFFGAMGSSGSTESIDPAVPSV